MSKISNTKNFLQSAIQRRKERARVKSGAAEPKSISALSESFDYNKESVQILERVPAFPNARRLRKVLHGSRIVQPLGPLQPRTQLKMKGPKKMMRFTQDYPRGYSKSK